MMVCFFVNEIISIICIISLITLISIIYQEPDNDVHDRLRQFRPLLGYWTEYMGAGQGRHSFQIICLYALYYLYHLYSSLVFLGTTAYRAHFGWGRRPAWRFRCTWLPQDQERECWSIGYLCNPLCVARQIRKVFVWVSLLSIWNSGSSYDTGRPEPVWCAWRTWGR